MIDTADGGFSSGSLATGRFDEMASARQVKDLDEVNAESIAGTQGCRNGQFPDVQLGEYKVHSPYFTESIRSSLGLYFWSRFVVTFDFRSKQVYLKPGKRYSHPDVRDRSGMRLLLDGGKVIVHSVKKGSVALKAGITGGDELWSLGSKRATEMGLQPTRNALSEPGATVAVVLRRGEKEIPVALALPSGQSQ